VGFPTWASRVLLFFFCICFLCVELCGVSEEDIWEPEVITLLHQEIQITIGVHIQGLHDAGILEALRG